MVDNMKHILQNVCKSTLLPALLLALLATIRYSAPVSALTGMPTTNQAGLVVVHADGSVVSRCVGFNEESISGFDLLVRGDFAPRSEVTGMGASVCSVDGQGCGEGEGCFCQCKSSTCTYWTYWQQLPEGWRYSNAGAATVQVHDGDVQGWVWGESKPNASAESAPPPLAFTDICNTDAVIYGIDEAAASVTASTNAASSQLWMIAVVIALPLLLGGVWWLRQQRQAPKVEP
jgi:hypothetical protein